MTKLCRWPSALAALCLTVAAGTAELSAQAPRERDFWRELSAADFQVPEGLQAVDLLLEMNALLGSTDPWLRDEVAYSAAARWIFRAPGLPDDELRRVMALWLGNLQEGTGNLDVESLLRRSFSALCLSLVAARDLRTPFLSPAEFGTLLDSTLTYLESERDLRGFDRQLGWIHTVAHTADVLKFMARNPRLRSADQRRILEALDAKLMAADEVLVWGEEARVAEVIRSLVARPDWDSEALDAWLGRWPERHRELWENGPMIDPDRFVRVQNGLQVLRSLSVSLSLADSSMPANQPARESVLGALARMR